MPLDNHSQTMSSGKLAKTLALFSLVAFAVLEFYFFKINYNPAGYAGAALLIFFGLWRIDNEKDPYQKVRIIVILSL